MTTTDLKALADRWDRLVMELDALLGESDTTHLQVPNIAYHAFSALRPLPGKIRDGSASAGRPPLGPVETEPLHASDHHPDETPFETDVDRMLTMLRAADPAELKSELVDGLNDLELKRVLNAVPDWLLDRWWRRAKAVGR